MTKTMLSAHLVTAMLLCAISAGAEEASAAASDAEADANLQQSLAYERGALELGLFGGMLNFSSEHDLGERGVPLQKFEDVAPEFGLRVGFLPIDYAGLEGEAAVSPTGTFDGASAVVGLFRVHALFQVPTEGIIPFAIFGLGAMSSSSDTNGDDTDQSVHFGIGAKLPLGDEVDARVDIRDTVSDARGDLDHPHFPELLFGLTWVIGGTPAPKPDATPQLPPDADGDGVPDGSDACPTEAAGTQNGCPVPDSDGDGIRDDLDQCPAVASPEPSGCPNPDPDGDGIGAEADKCPDVAAYTADGCPDLDADKDGVPVEQDKCPDLAETNNGFEDEDGCPDEIPQAVQQFTGVVEGIEFDFGQATIRKDSFAVLDEAVEVLAAHPTLRVRITGHTDASGTSERNVELSQQRADAVKAYLSSKGIAADRLEAVGMGSKQPVADNDTEAGKQKNRRIEFEIIQ